LPRRAATIQASRQRGRGFFQSTVAIRKGRHHGKGGKKDKEKSKKQKASKHEQSAKAKQDKNRPK
jgi:hypothetical protein